jgi:hypothetical protein
VVEFLRAEVKKVLVASSSEEEVPEDLDGISKLLGEKQKILASLPKSSRFIPYVPICPRGFVDCVWDPAYILYTDPDWYKELYGDKTPLEALWVDGGCMEKIEKDPKMEKYYCYDDEDK